MALRDRRIKTVLNYGGWWVQEVLPFEFHPQVFKKVASGGLDSLRQKRCQNSTGYFVTLPKTFSFQNIQIKLNLMTWMTLKSSAVIFQALEPLQPQWPQ